MQRRYGRARTRPGRRRLLAAAGALALFAGGCAGSAPPADVSAPIDVSLAGGYVGLLAASVSARPGTGADSALYDSILDSYYAGRSDPAWRYFQNRSITRFLAGWVKETTGIEKPQWDYDSFTTIEILDRDFAASRPDEKMYCCTFSDGAGRYGYIIVTYHPDGPALKNWGVTETTPYRYDLRPHFVEIMASLAATDIDLTTTTASRVYLYDRENKRADQVIRFTDAKGDNYLYDFADDAYTVEKYR